MIELVVVVLLIGVIGGMVLPRVMKSERRLAERECEEVRRVLSIAAARSALSGQGILISFDAREKLLSVFVLARIETNNGSKNQWESDRMILPVQLQSLAFRRGTADQQGLNASGWSVVFPTGEPRPMMWLAFSPASEPEATGWQIELMPDETGATRRRMNESSRASAAGLFRIDLDATNQGERAW
jgi:type II secretory pathway pseudopilin PulG